MEAPRSLRRPTNWQDFESLCKKLWGEIWDCPEIKKNGRNGQQQRGVDISGIPFGEDGYYGIQCKGKDEYTNKQFTEIEINEEIENAKDFQPPLKKLYLTTTAVKDVHIEEFVRKINLEHQSKGIFQVHLFCWEDIVDLIDENKHTHDWYVKSQNFKTKKSIDVSFQNGTKEMTFQPLFRKSITHYKRRIVAADSLYANPLGAFIRQQNSLSAFVVRSTFSYLQINRSFISFDIFITNTGNDPIEDYKIFLQFEGGVRELSDTNEVGTNIARIVNKYIPNTVLWTESMSGKIIPKNKILVGDDYLSSETIYLKPEPFDGEIVLKWKLISKDFKESGELKLIVKPDIKVKYSNVLVDDLFEVKTIESEVEDYIEDKKGKE